MIVEYVVFFLAAFVLIVAVFEINKRISRHNKRSANDIRNWVELDTKQPDAREDRSLAIENGSEEEAEVHMRAKQNGHNGHHAESQKPQI